MPEPRDAQAGLTLIEALIALAILSMLAIGLLPLFTQSITRTTQGGSYTVATNAARSALERYLQLDFNAPELTLAPGQTQLVSAEAWDYSLRTWIPANPAGAGPAGTQWRRVITVEQYSAADLLEDGRLTEPLPGDAPADVVQLKLIRVRSESLLGDTPIFGRPTRVTLEAIKAI
jgi:prepilin-type N-terminal cleavage/methylation domain-containing protein